MFFFLKAPTLWCSVIVNRQVRQEIAGCSGGVLGLKVEYGRAGLGQMSRPKSEGVRNQGDRLSRSVTSTISKVWVITLDAGG